MKKHRLYGDCDVVGCTRTMCGIDLSFKFVNNTWKGVNCLRCLETREVTRQELLLRGTK